MLPRSARFRPRRPARLGTRLGRAVAAAALPLACAAAVPAQAAVPYPGVQLNPPGKAYEHSHAGAVFVRVYCPGTVYGEPRGFCTGTITLRHAGRVIGEAPLAVADYDGPSVEVRLAGWFRAKARRAGTPLPVDVTMNTHDLQGIWTRTAGDITIATPPRGREPGDPAPPLPAIRASDPPRAPRVPAVPSYAGVPELAAIIGDPGQRWNSTAPGAFGGGRQAQGGDRQYDNPGAVAVDERGLLYAADTSNNRIEVFSPSGRYLRSFGTYGFDPGAAREAKAFASFNNPVNLVVRDGRAFVVDQRNDRVMAWSVDGTPRPLLRIGRRGSGPGRMVHPWDVAIAGSELLVIDQANYRIDRFTLGGHPLGSFGEFGTGRGQFQMPFSLAVAPDGRIVVADQMRNRILVFSAGHEFLGEFGEGGLRPGQLNRPQGIAIDGAGRLVVANTRSRRIDRFTLDGEFLDSFGYGPEDRTAPDIVDRPVDLAVDRRDGALYVADAGNQHPSGRCGRFGLPDPDPCRARRILKYAEPGASPAPDAGLAGDDGAAAVGSGSVRLVLDPKVRRALDHVRVRAAAGSSTAAFAVRSGRAHFGSPAFVDRLEAAGRMTLAGPDGRTSIPAPGLRWTNAGPRLTGESSRLFTLSIAGLSVRGTTAGGIRVTGLSLRLSAAGARALNRGLRIDVFSRAYPFGALDIALAPAAAGSARRGAG